MHPPKMIRFALPLGCALILAACGGKGPGWTYAPLGPSPAPTEAASATPGSSSAAAVTLEVKTTDASPLAFEPQMLEAPAGTVVQVDYLNDSSLPHNINFFAGSDATAQSLGATDVVTGPGKLESVTFTTPSAPGDYYFWCDVHQAAMSGMLHVTP